MELNGIRVIDMKKLAIILFSLLSVIPAEAQLGTPFVVPDLSVVSCVVGNLGYQTAGIFGLYVCNPVNTWSLVVTPVALVPVGAIVFIDTGTCPTGYTEDSSLNGKMWRGTITANGNVGGIAGSDTITPSGSVTASTFTGNSVTSSAVSAGTPVGTNSTGTVTATGTINTPTIAWPAGVPTNAAITAGTPAGTISALTTGADSSTVGGVAKAIAQTPTFTGSALATHTHVISWPAGVPTSNTLTFTGTSAVTSAEIFTGSALGTHTHTTVATGTNSVPTFNGTQFDNRPAYINLIGCKKN